MPYWAEFIEILEGPSSRGGHRERFSPREASQRAFGDWSPHSQWTLRRVHSGGGGLLPTQICSLCFMWASFTFSSSVEGGGCSRWQPIMSWYTKTPAMEPRSGETMGTHHQCRPVLEGEHRKSETGRQEVGRKRGGKLGSGGCTHVKTSEPQPARAVKRRGPKSRAGLTA